MRRTQEFDKDRNSSFLNEDLDVVVFARGDVGEAPGGFELELGVVSLLDEVDELRHKVSVNHSLKRRVFLEGEQSSKADGGEQLVQSVIRVDQSQKLVEISNLYIQKNTRKINKDGYRKRWRESLFHFVENFVGRKCVCLP